MAYPAYPEYQQKNSHEVPRDWKFHRLKFSVTYNDESLPENTDPDFEIAYVDISSVNLVDGITAMEEMTFGEAPSRARRIVRDGDTIISTVRTYLKAIAPVKNPPENMIVSTGFAVIRPLESIDQRFLGYVLQNASFVGEVVANSTGVSYPAINPSTLVCISFSYPKDIAEQQQIADFLDWKTGQIDGLIAKKKQLIEKLKEKRIALITQAVTKGLNPDAPMRDSGIPWLGDVPEHWEVVPLGFLVDIVGGMTPSMANPNYWEGEIPWVTPKDMKRERIEDSIDHITDIALDETSLSLINSGVVLIVVRGMILAHSFPTAITEKPVTINQDMKALRCGDRLAEEFLFRCLSGFSKTIVSFAQESAHGTRKLETMTIKKLFFPVPPKPEQMEITHSIEMKLNQLDHLAGATAETIISLTEYRTALITAATTGKIDVRNVKIEGAK